VLTICAGSICVLPLLPGTMPCAVKALRCAEHMLQSCRLVASYRPVAARCGSSQAVCCTATLLPGTV
jgi:hypothetical protein